MRMGKVYQLGIWAHTPQSGGQTLPTHSKIPLLFYIGPIFRNFCKIAQMTGISDLILPPDPVFGPPDHP